MQAQKSTGTVVWFDRQRGHGFIRRADTGAEIFVHYSNIIVDAGRRKQLRTGDIVEFRIQTVIKSQAIEVKAVGHVTQQAGRMVG